MKTSNSNNIKRYKKKDDRFILNRKETLLKYNIDKEEVYNNSYSNYLCNELFNYQYPLNNEIKKFNKPINIIKPLCSLDICVHHSNRKTNLDDFYLNLLDWNSNSNIIAFSKLDICYYWKNNYNYNTYRREVEYIPLKHDITSISSSKCGNYLSLGTEASELSIWDVNRNIKLTQLNNSDSEIGRITTSIWNNHILSIGTFSGFIVHYDMRIKRSIIGTSNTDNHQGEVCVLSWNKNGTKLVSGSNDNTIKIWSIEKLDSYPLFTKEDHEGAVKAIDWKPDSSSSSSSSSSYDILITGGGYTDRSIKFWNINENECKLIESIDTGNQVCKLIWRNNLELISSINNSPSTKQITIWNYNHMYYNNHLYNTNYSILSKKAYLDGHKERVLHMAKSPDSNTLLTLSNDKTLKFWNLNQNKDGDHNKNERKKIDYINQIR